MSLSWVGEEIETVALPRLSTKDQAPCLGDQEKQTNRFTLRSTLAYDFEQRLFRPLHGSESSNASDALSLGISAILVGGMPPVVGAALFLWGRRMKRRVDAPRASP